MPPILVVLHGFPPRWQRASLTAIGIGLLIAAALFSSVLVTAIAHDFVRNRGRQERQVFYDPLLFWRVFLVIGALMLIALAAFLHNELWWVRLSFVAAASAIFIVQRWCLRVSGRN
jgi:hypothetical protein